MHLNRTSIYVSGLLLLGAPGSFGETNAASDVRIGMSAPIIVREAPPQRGGEPKTPAPGANHVWVPSHASWRDGAWLWVAGAWVIPPQPGLVWVQGRWDAPTNSWTPEHWKYAQTTTPPAVTMAPATVAQPVIVREAPPPPRIERQPNRPGPRYVWVNGYWIHRARQHVWVPGRWELPPTGHRTWIEPRWERRGAAYVFIEGRWF